MHRVILARAQSGALLLFLLAGCSDKNSGTTPTDCTAFGEVGETGACAELCPVTNSAYCSHEAVPLDCADLEPRSRVEVCGVPLPAPPTTSGTVVELERSDSVSEFSAGGPVDLSCFEPGGYPEPPGASSSATMKGIVKIFSAGCQSRDVDIEVHTVTGDGELGELVGSPVKTEADCTETGVAEENDKCETRYECLYSYAGVPTETELIVLTQGDLWNPLYEYGVYVPNAEVVDGEYEKDIRALEKGDYSTLAQTAMGKTITPGHGALGGEVHDCGNIRLVNAVADIDQTKFLTTYFTNDEDQPVPNPSAKATGLLSIYAALDVPPGPVTVAAAGVLDGKLVGVGYQRARIFENAVTSVTFRGLRPYQIPPQ